MSLTDFIPPQYKFAALALVLAMAALALFAYGHHQYTKGEAAGQAQVLAQWNAQKVKQQDAALAEAAANARETQRRLERQGDAQHDYDTQLAVAQSGAAAATNALERLRRRATQLTTAASGSVRDPAAGLHSAPAGDPAVLFTDVLSQLGERARLLADYADAASRIGLQCDRDYDALHELKAH